MEDLNQIEGWNQYAWRPLFHSHPSEPAESRKFRLFNRKLICILLKGSQQAHMANQAEPAHPFRASHLCGQHAGVKAFKGNASPCLPCHKAQLASGLLRYDRRSIHKICVI